LREELEKTGFTQRELALRTGRPFKTISEIMNGKTRITPDTAIQLENVLGVPAGFWLEAESKYREFQARMEENKELVNQVELLEDCPLSALKERGCIPDIRLSAILVKEVIGFYGVNALSQIDEIYFGGHVHSHPPIEKAGNRFHLAAWIRQGEIQANPIQTAPYKEELFRKSLEKVRNPNGRETGISIHDIHQTFREAGVALIYIPQYPGCRIDTLVRWLRPDKALIQFGIPLTAELEFYSSLFHAAVHLLAHSKKKVYLDDFREVTGRDKIDREADIHARNLLIPDEEYQQIRADTPLTREKVIRYAHRLQVSPGFIVGRLQQEGIMPKHWMNYLKKMITDWDEFGPATES
ncbi:MAG: helix-turn-helix domain-containing protein, partial [Balneolaceae bacterium]